MTIIYKNYNFICWLSDLRYFTFNAKNIAPYIHNHLDLDLHSIQEKIK